MGQLVDFVDFAASFVLVGIDEARRELRFDCNDGEAVAQHIMHGGGIGLALVRAVQLALEFPASFFVGVGDSYSNDDRDTHSDGKDDGQCLTVELR